MHAKAAAISDQRYALIQMTKTILIALIAALAGCADDDDRGYLKSELTCGDTWQDVGRLGKCDAACVPRPEQAGDACLTALEYTPMGGTKTTFECPATFEIDGVRGCCDSPFNGDAMIKAGVDGEPSRTRRIFFLTCKGAE